MCMQECQVTSPRNPRSVSVILYAIEAGGWGLGAGGWGCSAEQRRAARKARVAPLMQSLYDWILQQMKTLSRHLRYGESVHTPAETVGIA